MEPTLFVRMPTSKVAVAVLAEFVHDDDRILALFVSRSASRGGVT